MNLAAHGNTMVTCEPKSENGRVIWNWIWSYVNWVWSCDSAGHM